MTETTVAALITVGGMLGVAILSAIVQVKVTRRVVDAEHQKVIRRIGEEATVRAHEARRERLHAALVDVIQKSEPELFRKLPDIDGLTRAVHEAQLLLIRSRPLEGAVNDAINRIALELHGNGAGPRNLHTLMELHGALIDRSGRLLEAIDAPISERSYGVGRNE